MRQIFFSFHYNRDVWRALMVRNMGKVDNSSTFSDNDWEEVRFKSDARIKAWIDEQMAIRSCIVVLVGQETSERKWVKYEIEQAMKLHKGIVDIHIHNLENQYGEQDNTGSNLFYNVITPSGHRLSNYVTLFANLVNSMSVFVKRYEKTSGLQDISSALTDRCNTFLDKLLEESNFYHALSSDDHTRIAIYGNNLLMSIEWWVGKVLYEVVMCFVRALFPDQKCLRFILSMISFLAEKHKQEMNSDNYREMLLSILDKYAGFDFSESNESIPHIFYHLQRIAKYFEEYAETRPSVNYCLNDEMANRFNV